MRKYKVYKGKARQKLIQDIRMLREEGLTLREVGQLKGVSHEMVRRLEKESKIKGQKVYTTENNELTQVDVIIE